MRSLRFRRLSMLLGARDRVVVVATWAIVDLLMFALCGGV